MANENVRAKWGEVQKWLSEVAIPHSGDDCLIFPFGRCHDGYGDVRQGGRVTKAHTVVIEATSGQRPSPKHECRHLCGNGHLGCVSPKHLKWGTHAQNMADAVAHGTTKNGPRYGENHHDFRATDEVVAAILIDLGSGISQRAVANRHGFSQSHISRIKQGWRRAKV